MVFLGPLILAIALLLAPTPALAQATAESVAGQIKTSVNGKLRSFYRTRGYWPMWIEDGKLGPAAERLIAWTSTSHLDGLDPDDYDIDDLRKTVAAARTGSPEALAAAELELSKTLAEYVRDLRRPSRMKITYLDQELVPVRPSEADVLRAAALAPSFSRYVDRAGWMHPFYTRLREALARHSERWGRLPHVVVPPGPMLRKGAKDSRVRLLRQRLGLPNDTRFDKELVETIREFQADHGLQVDGVAGEATIGALNQGAARHQAVMRLNLERAKFLPSAFTRHIVVNAATAELWLFEKGEQQDMMRVIVGKPTEQTPMLAGMMRYAILHPYWNVPSDLVQQRIAPKVMGGASFARMNYQALSDWSGNPQLLDPAAIDWAAVADGRQNLRVRQLPGKNNAMGRMKFMFPNDLGIYLHDTPDKALFKEKRRWFSSGCVRLEDAPRLAKWLFGKPIEAGSEEPEQQLPLPEPVPVHLTYLTASPTDSGITFPLDGYGRDGPALRQLARR